MAVTSVVVIQVDLVGLEPVKFLAAVGKATEEAPGMTGYEVQSELRRAFDDLAVGLQPNAG